MKVLIADIETDGLLAKVIHCIGLKLLWEPTSEPVIYADHPDYPSFDEAIEKFQEADRIVFHNGLAFDVPIILRLLGDEAIDTSKVFDTLVASRLLAVEKQSHSLGALGEELGFPKTEFSDWSQFSKEMASYCKNDVNVLHEVYETLNDCEFEEALAMEHNFQWVMGLQQAHGFRLDVQAAQLLDAELRQELADIEREMQEKWQPIVTERWSEKTGKRLKDGIEVFNPGSRQQIAQRLIAEYKWKPRQYTPTGVPKIDENILKNLKYPEAQRLGRYFRCQKMRSQISEGDAAWLKLERDGYVHGAMRTIGAATHRCAHHSPNMANVDKKDPRMREVWLPDPGQVLVGCDADALELVCLAHYLGKWDDGEYAKALLEGSKDNGTDVHSRTQRLLELPNRDAAKTAQYGYLYGASDRKLAQISREGGGVIKDGKEIRRRMNEGITGLGKLSEAISKRADVGYFKAIDGRHIKIKSPHSALNFLLQSTGAILMKTAVDIFHFDLATEAGHVVNGYPKTFAYCANVHDEQQITTDQKYADELGKMFCRAITLAAERLKLRCPLSGTYSIGNNWKETH